MKVWREIESITIKNEDGLCRVRKIGRKLLIEQQFDEVEDITDDCFAELTQSRSSDGCYITLRRCGGGKVAIFGVKGKMEVMPGYELRKPNNAALSFRVVKV